MTTCQGRGLVACVKRQLATIAATALLALLPLAAVAVGTASADQPRTRAEAERILAEIDRDSGQQAALVRRPAEQARKALERATGARSSGDSHHAEQLEALACEWALTARDLVRTVLAEADAGAMQIALGDATVRGERARALLEEAIARRGRALAEMEKIDAGPSQSSAKTKTKGAAPRPKEYGAPP